MIALSLLLKAAVDTFILQTPVGELDDKGVTSAEEDVLNLCLLGVGTASRLYVVACGLMEGIWKCTRRGNTKRTVAVANNPSSSRRETNMFDVPVVHPEVTVDFLGVEGVGIRRGAVDVRDKVRIRGERGWLD
jgi:hypothetical protein